MFKYNCIICGKESKCDNPKDPLLCFCKDCKNSNQELYNTNRSLVQKKHAEEQKIYWDAHPEEHKAFIEERNKKRDNTLIAKYGSIENAKKLKMEKQMATLKEKYPDEDWEHITNPSQLKIAKENIRKKASEKDKAFYEERKKKANKTKIEKYGSLENAYSTMIENQKATLKEKYGVENVSQIEGLSEKRGNTLKKKIEENPNFWEERNRKGNQTKIEKYGSLEKANLAMRESLRRTCLEKYSTTNVMEVPEFKEKLHKTWEEKKLENPNYYEPIKQKIENTLIEKHGSLEEAKKVRKIKREKTCLEKYGFITPLQNEEVKQKIKNTIKERYGVEDNISQRPGHAEKMKKAIDAKAEAFEKENNCTRWNTLIEKYGQGWFRLNLPYLKNNSYCFVSNEYLPQIEEYYKLGHSSVSHAEKEVLDFVKSIYSREILENVRNIINPMELDIYIPEKKLAIEYNGDFWHSTNGKNSKNYHEEKSKACEKLGIRLIHIYECEWIYSREKLESLIRIALGCGYSKIGARKCEVRKISNKEAMPFNEKNHLQGHKNAKVTYGLFYNGELQQLMSFSKCKYNRNLKGDNDWEIIRGCPGSNNQIVGGVSKLFKTFIREYNPDSVFSYCDFNKFDGKGYEALGMQFVGYTGPDKFYVDKSEHKVNRNPKKRKQLEESCMFTIWGAGSKKYLWKKNA